MLITDSLKDFISSSSLKGYLAELNPLVIGISSGISISVRDTNCSGGFSLFENLFRIDPLSDTSPGKSFLLVLVV